MASYGVQITLPIPSAGQVQWSGPLNDLLQSFIDVLAARVTVDGIDITASLNMQGNALINALNVQFIPNGDTGVANTLYYSGGELWLRDGTNRTVQITSGGVVNVAGSGGFGGDYISANQNGASYTSATQTFSFTSSGGTVYSALESEKVKIHNGSSAYSVTLQSPTIAANETITLPGTNPATRTFLMMDATGSLYAEAGMARDARGLIVSGSTSISGTIYVADVYGTSLSAGTGSFPVLKGLRDILLQNPQTVIVPAIAGYASSPSFLSTTNTPPSVTVSTGGSNCAAIPAPVKVGDRIDSWVLAINKGTASGKMTAQLYKYSSISGIETAIGGPTNSSTTLGVQTFASSSFNATVNSSEMYYLKISGCGVTGDTVTHASFGICRPTGSV